MPVAKESHSFADLESVCPFMKPRLAFLLSVMIIPSAFCQAPEPNKKALDLVVPILDARREGLPAAEDDTRRKKAAQLLMHLFDDTRQQAAEAMAILLGFDLGVDCDQALLFEAKVRGVAMLAYLSRYHDQPPRISGKEYPSTMLLSPDRRKRRYGDAMDAIRTGKKIPALDRKVARLVVPILDALERALREGELFNQLERHTEAESDRYEELLYSLFNNKSAAADEAIVVLMDYYLGTHPGEEHREDLSERTKRLLPYLRKHRDQYFAIPGRRYGYSMRHNFEGRKSGRDWIISELQSGKDPWAP